MTKTALITGIAGQDGASPAELPDVFRMKALGWQAGAELRAGL